MSGPFVPLLINVGNAPEDGTGDPDRDAWDKVNANFLALAGLIGGTTDLSPITKIIGRFQEYRVLMISTVNATLNDGDALSAQLIAMNRFGGTTIPSDGLIGFNFLTGSTNPTFRVIDNRRCYSPEPGAAQRVCYALRPYNLQLAAATDWRPSFGSVTSDVSAVPTTLFSTSIMGWFRKRNGGDSSHSRVTFGFADNTAVFPSREVARFGLVGDGAGGYRFGSVNCPVGLAAPADNGATDIDANSFAPPELLNANLGTNWFHVRIKVVPPTPTTAGKWGAYLNGVLVAVFTDPNNFASGSNTSDNHGTRTEPVFLNFGDSVSAIPAPAVSDPRLWIEEDLTLV